MMSVPTEDSGTANTARVRTRQGCLTCRKRRRKCDEHKPKCQNCTGRGLTCRYGVQLTFLQANTFTLLPEEAQALQDTTPTRYGSLQFVDGLSENAEPLQNATPEAEVPDSTHSVPETARETQRGDEAWQNNNGEEGLIDDSDVPVTHEHEHEHYHHDQPLPSHQHLTNGSPSDRIVYHQHNLTNSSPSDRIVYHQNTTPLAAFPQDNLSQSLGLANDTRYERNGYPSVTSEQRHIPAQAQSTRQPLSTITHYLRSPQDAHTSDMTLSIQNSNPRNQTYYDSNEVLLKFYIDEVAPWLDTCTADSSFGIQIPILSKQSQPIFDAIKALTCCQLSLFLPPRDVDILQSAEVTRRAIASVGSDVYSNSEEAVAACALLTISQLMPRVVIDWHPILKERTDSFASLSINGFWLGHRASVSWAILRLDIAHSLFCQLPIMTPLENWQDPSYPFSTPEPNHLQHNNSSSNNWTRHAILICGHAARYHFSSPHSRSMNSDAQHTELWTRLWSSTQWWSQHHSPSMYPILSSSISSIVSEEPSTFPLIIHTNRANLLAAVMYHTASLLLLEVKPRYLRRTSQLKTPTWHAVQICGLCISNDAQWSWDPVIIAALIYAGRLISYQEQKDELEKLLLDVAKGSGWRVGEQIEDMLEGWRADVNL